MRPASTFSNIQLSNSREILTEFEVEFEIKAIEVIDYVEMRKQLKEKLITILHVTVREANEILKVLRKEIAGTG